MSNTELLTERRKAIRDKQKAIIESFYQLHGMKTPRYAAVAAKHKVSAAYVQYLVIRSQREAVKE